MSPSFQDGDRAAGTTPSPASQSREVTAATGWSRTGGLTVLNGPTAGSRQERLQPAPVPLGAPIKYGRFSTCVIQQQLVSALMRKAAGRATHQTGSGKARFTPVLAATAPITSLVHHQAGPLGQRTGRVRPTRLAPSRRFRDGGTSCRVPRSRTGRLFGGSGARPWP